MRILSCSAGTLLALVAATFLASCGGGGGGGGDGASAGGNAVAATSLGSRKLPGCDVAVDRAASSAPGTLTFRVRLSPSSQALESLGVRVGSDLASDGYAAASVVAGEPGVYAITVTQPTANVTGQRVWVRVALTDGSVLESGSDDFLL